MVTHSARISSAAIASEYPLVPLEGCAAERIKSLHFGPPGSLDFRVLFLNKEDKELVSPWHEISLYRPDGLLSCVCKTPAGSWVRYEAAGDEPYNPLRVARLRTALRNRQASEFVPNAAAMAASRNGRRSRGISKTFDDDYRGDFMEAIHVIKPASHFLEHTPDSLQLISTKKAKGGAPLPLYRPAHYADNSPWNLGMLPQTWAASGRPPRGYCPLEVVEIGADKIREPGEVYLVKPLGAYSVDDGGGVLTWKIMAIASDDAMAPMLHDATDVSLWLPGMLENIREWLRTCLCTRPGDRESYFHLNSRPAKFAVTKTKIAEFHEAWRMFPGRHLVHPKAGQLDPKKLDNADELQKAWSNFTPNDVRDSKSGLDTIPTGCPLQQSSVMFDPNWLKASATKAQSLSGLYSQLSEPIALTRSKSIKLGGTIRRARKGIFGFLSRPHWRESQGGHHYHHPPPLRVPPSSPGGGRKHGGGFSSPRKPESKISPKGPSGGVKKSSKVLETKSVRFNVENVSRLTLPDVIPTPSPTSQSEGPTPKQELSESASVKCQSALVEPKSAQTSPAVPLVLVARSPWGGQLKIPRDSTRRCQVAAAEVGDLHESMGDSEEEEEHASKPNKSPKGKARRKGRRRGRSMELPRSFNEAEMVFAEVTNAKAMEMNTLKKREMKLESPDGIMKLKWLGYQDEQPDESGSDSDASEAEAPMDSGKKLLLRRSISLQEFSVVWDQDD